MLNKIQQLLSYMGQRGLRYECAHLCHLEKIAQTQQTLFPPSITNETEIVFYAGRNKSGDYRCAGCGETFTRDDISGFYTETQIEDSELEDAPIYKEKFPSEEYNPNIFMPNYREEIPLLLNDFLSLIRRLIQVLNHIPPQNLEFEKQVNTAQTDEQSPQALSKRILKIKIDDVSQVSMSDLESLSLYYNRSYRNLIDEGFMLYLDGEEIRIDDYPSVAQSIGHEDWALIKAEVKSKVENIYKVSLGKNNDLDDIKSELEKVGDQIRNYKSVIPSFIKSVLAKAQEAEGPTIPSHISGQALRSSIYGLFGQGTGRRGGQNVFGDFLFPTPGVGMSSHEYIDSLINFRMLYGNNYIMQLQQAADGAESVVRVINEYSPQASKLDPIGGAVRMYDFRKAYKLVKYPICEECSEELMDNCSDCDEAYLREELDYSNNDGEAICEGCGESYSSCDNCSAIVYTGDGGWGNEQVHITEDGEIFCGDCHQEAVGVDRDSLMEDLEQALSGGVLGLNTPHETGGRTQTALLPIPSNLLDRAVPVIRKLKIGDIKNLINPDSSDLMATKLQSIVNKIQSQGLSKEDSFILMDAMKGFMRKEYSSNNEYAEEQFKNGIEDFISNLKRQISANNSFYDAYPLTRKDADGNIVTVKRQTESGKKKRLEAIRRFCPIPVDYDIVESRYNDAPSFTVVMNPSDKMIAMATLLFGEKGKEAWNLLSRRGTQHHRGSIAYARISKVEGESLVINNLQRDSDLYNLGKNLLNEYKESEPILYNAIKWWDKKLKFWHVQFLLTLTELAKAQGEELFLTPFKVQEYKWSRVPERNRDAYNTVPAEMSAANRANLEAFYTGREEEDKEEIISEELFPRMEYYDGEVERVSSGNDLWRLAKDFERKRMLSKIAAYINS